LQRREFSNVVPNLTVVISDRGHQRRVNPVGRSRRGACQPARRLGAGSDASRRGKPRWSPDGRRIAYVTASYFSARQKCECSTWLAAEARTRARAESVTTLPGHPTELAYAIETDDEEVDGTCLGCHGDLRLYRARTDTKVIFSASAALLGRGRRGARRAAARRRRRSAADACPPGRRIQPVEITLAGAPASLRL
jgi:hypothetical protein